MPSGRKPNLQRRRHVMRLRAQGLSLSEIARRFRISKQAVWSLLNHRPRLTSARAIPCSRCGGQIRSAGALPRDAESALCTTCLNQSPDSPFGQRLKSLRLAAGLSLTDLSRRTGLSPGSIRAYEEGLRMPRRATIGRLVRVVGGGLLSGTLSPVRRSCYSDAS
jgi:transcriptional regulator with XRE-family HTH domain